MRRFALRLVCFFVFTQGVRAGVFDRLEIRPVSTVTFTNFDFSYDQGMAWGWREGLEIWSGNNLGVALGYQDFGSSFEDYTTRYAIFPVLVTPPRIGGDFKQRLQARGTYVGVFVAVTCGRSFSVKLELGAVYLFRASRSDISLFYAHDYSFVPQGFEDIRPDSRLNLNWSPRPEFLITLGVSHTAGNGRVRVKQDPVVEFERGQPHLRLTSYEPGFSLRPRIGRWRNLDWSVSVGSSVAAVSWIEATDVTWGYTLQSAFVPGHRIELDTTCTNFARAKHQYFGRLLDLDPIHRGWDGGAIDMDTTRLALARDFEISSRFSIRPPLGAQRFPLQIPNPFIFEPARSEADPSAHVTTALLLMQWSFSAGLLPPGFRNCILTPRTDSPGLLRP